MESQYLPTRVLFDQLDCYEKPLTVSQVCTGLFGIAISNRYKKIICLCAGNRAIQD